MIAIKNLSIVSLPSAIAAKVRQTLRDDYGNQLAAQIDDGSAPCRHCLRIAHPGEEVVLFSYRPFSKPSLYQEVGPVFIHAHTCPSYPRDADFPPVFLRRALVLRAYSAHDNIYDEQVYAAPGEARALVQQMLENPEVAYVHARSVSRGCYLFRIERS